MQKSGFTLAEILIALSLLGVIAVFSIPKILQGVDDNRKKRVTLEAIATVSGAYQQFKLQNNYGDSPPITTVAEDLVPYINHATPITDGTLVDTTPSYFALNGAATYACTSTSQVSCYRLLNGSILTVNSTDIRNIGSFGGSSPVNCTAFGLDPDGKSTGLVDSIGLYLYYNGAIRSDGTLLPGSRTIVRVFSPYPDPNWFSWN